VRFTAARRRHRGAPRAVNVLLTATAACRDRGSPMARRPAPSAPATLFVRHAAPWPSRSRTSVPGR
jgi:hypothetical protein